MDKFIYVFSKEARDTLLKQNYILLVSDDRNLTYVFENKSNLNFALGDISYITSDTISF